MLYEAYMHKYRTKHIYSNLFTIWIELVIAVHNILGQLWIHIVVSTGQWTVCSDVRLGEHIIH